MGADSVHDVLVPGGGNAAMGTLLAVHLGTVMALFPTLPCGKSVHAADRFVARVPSRRAQASAAGDRLGMTRRAMELQRPFMEPECPICVDG